MGTMSSGLTSNTNSFLDYIFGDNLVNKCSNFSCNAPEGTPAGDGYKYCPTPRAPNEKCLSVSAPPKVKRFKFYNACEWDIALYGWDCIIPKDTTCYVGEKNSCSSGQYNYFYNSNDIYDGISGGSWAVVFFQFIISRIWSIFPNTTIISNSFSRGLNELSYDESLPICSEVSPQRESNKPYPTRIAWYIVDSIGSGEDPNHKIMDMVEINSSWSGPNDVMQPPTFSSYDGFSMSRFYTALTLDEDQVACIDSGAKSTVPDPIPKSDGVYICGVEELQNPGGPGTDPGWACKQKSPNDPTYLKKNSFATGPTQSSIFLNENTCRAVEYPCVDQCVTGEHNWPAGT